MVKLIQTTPNIDATSMGGRSNFKPRARQQIAAVAQLRWRIFANSLRTKRGRLDLASRIFIGLAFFAGGIGGAIGLGGGAWFLFSHGNGKWLGALLWPVFLFWQLFPLMATAFTRNVESSSLLRFPLSYPSYFLIRMAYGSLDPSTAVAVLWLLGIDVGIGVAHPAIFPWASIVLGIFALVNIVLARMLFAWLERWLAQRRTREIMGVLFFLFVLSFQLVGPLLNAYEHGSVPETRILGQHFSNAQRPLPPGLAAQAIAGAINKPGNGSLAQRLSATGLSFLLLGCYGIGFLWLLNFRLRAEYRGENLSETAGRRVSTRGLAPVHPGWNLPGLPGPVAAVFEKEVRYLSRSGPMLFTLIVPLFMLAVFRSSGTNEGLFAHAPGLTFPLGAAYSLLLLTNLSYNNFGADGAGSQFFFASPVRFGQIVMGKNLVHATIFLIELALVWVGTRLLYQSPSLGVSVATLAASLFVVPIDLAAGNLFSLYSPSRVEAGIFGRQRASLTTVLASFVIRGALFGTSALLLWLGRSFANSWTEWIILLMPAAFSFAVYAFVLEKVDGIALKHRENLVSSLGRRE